MFHFMTPDQFSACDVFGTGRKNVEQTSPVRLTGSSRLEQVTVVRGAVELGYVGTTAPVRYT